MIVIASAFKYRMIIMAGAFLLDYIMGDPVWLWHPVVMIGKLIGFLEKKLRKRFPGTPAGEAAAGGILVCLVSLLSFGIPFMILKALYSFLPPAAVLLEIFWGGQLLAARSLKRESMKVYERLRMGSIQEARTALSMIVGRDTGMLDKKSIIKAAVETVAENTSDGVTAPLFYFMLGGAPLMFLYKGINTMDSMLGYKNEEYLWFGKCAARLDDAANFIPSRLTGLIMAAGSFAAGLDQKNALRIYRRDRYCHTSPNSGQTEAAMAGALHIQLGGDAFYFGKLYHKPVLGDDDRPPREEDIPAANRLMYTTSVFALVLFIIPLFFSPELFLHF